MKFSRVAAAGSGILLAVAAPILIVEALARVSPYRLPGNGRILAAQRMLDREIYRRDPELGHCLKTPFDRRLSWKNFDLWVRHDPLPGAPCGYRADAEGRGKVGIDVAVLGDSHVYGMEVGAGSTWVSLLGKRSGLGVANLGVRMYGTTQSVELYRRYGRALRPRLVLILLCPNDPWDNVVFDDWLGKKGLVPPMDADEMLYRVCRTLHLESFPAACRSVAGFGKLGLLPHMLLGRSVAYLYGGSSAGSRMEETGLFLLRRDVLVLREMTRGAGFAVVLNEGWADARRKELAMFLEKSRVPYLDLSYTMPAGERTRVALDGHWNALGHQRVAERIFEFLRRERLLR